MAETPTWKIPYPDLDDPADIQGEQGLDNMAIKLDTLLTQLRASGSIPGEVKLWPGGVLPDLATYGRWAWADGASYATATYPLASANIAAAWRTAHGQSDPGAGNFRVPDLRGLTPVGLDAMPGGTRANRTQRAVAITIAARTGEEYHVISVPEMPAHGHAVNDPGHGHPISPNAAYYFNSGSAIDNYENDREDRDNHISHGGAWIGGSGTGIWLSNAGGGGAHETMQPSVFVPWIVKLDD